MIIFHVTPIGYVRQTRADRWKKRPCVLRYRAYRDEVRLKAGSWRPQDGDLYQFHLPMPKSWSKKKRAEMDGKAHRQKPDLDNLTKALWDCFGEDSHLAAFSAAKYWTAGEGQIQIVQADGSP